MASDETDSSFEVESFEVEEENSLIVEVWPNANIAQGIQPYAFEPLAAAAGPAPAPSVPEETRDVTEWCTCGHCAFLSAVENVCCRQVPKVMRRCEQVAGVSCITLHPGFEGNCLNPYVLQGVLQTYMQLYGDIPEEIPTRGYRYLAYRSLVRWCWGVLKDRYRVVIPACAVTKIRQHFPEDSGEYVGFLPPLN